jgi:carboxyl-terminal processing protease
MEPFPPPRSIPDMRFLILWALLFPAAPVHAADGPSPQATAYLDAALKIMQEHFVYRDKIDWEQLRRDTFSQAANAQTSVETYPAIRFALERLGDHHSYLQLTPDLMRQAASRGIAAAINTAAPPRNAKAVNPFPSPFRTRRVPEGAMVALAVRPIAQLVIPLFSGPDPDAFATRIQSVVADLASRNPCAWIVDLRGNGGGNIWPMMAGVGPILGEGEPGGVLHSGGVRDKWFYENGKAGERDDPKDPYYAKTNGAPVKLNGTPPVAVLIDRDTGSSGEGIAVAFRGRPETRFFGETTYGAATSTFPYTLSDGAQIYLVTGVMIDRKGSEYPFGVTPDQEILSDFSISTNDPVIRTASEWLSDQRACR